MQGKLFVDIKKYQDGSHGFKLGKLLEEPNNFNVMFQHCSGFFATLIEINHDSKGFYSNFILLSDKNNKIIQTTLEMMFEWKFIAMIEVKNGDKS